MKTFKQYMDERCWTGYKEVPGKKAFSKGSCVKEDGSVGPTNVVGSGAIAGTGGKGGEPGIQLPRKKKSPILMSLARRRTPQA